MKYPSLQEIASHADHFAIDSRKIGRGGLFFSLPGEKVDGNQFLDHVAKKGALGAVVTKSYKGPDFGLQLLAVDDVKEALQYLAKIAMTCRTEKVIGITGSMGKTTTKEFLATLLSAKFRVAKTPGNYNSQLTLPITVLNLKGEYDYLILEMGMSEHGHIQTLVNIAPPDMGVVTRIAPAGMEGFKGGVHAIARHGGRSLSSRLDPQTEPFGRSHAETLWARRPDRGPQPSLSLSEPCCYRRRGS